ncbi:hypothetical protein PanWU01x14_253670 [Parasponia andersonii]|uniref:Uncharacterized protein n=1 Tax=Parasponia andersonii TaxID=3476 RepID=A0A2P5BBH2_PARAD|nr:hypothetical protein PanWU01x14_253670 [Parasponia andersonii]
MRPYFTISLLLLSLLLFEQAQGIRFGKWYVIMSSLGEQYKSIIHHEKEIASSKTLKDNDHIVAGGEAIKIPIACKDRQHCSGISRKLFSVTLPSTTTTTTSKNEKINGKNNIKAHDDPMIANGDRVKSTSSTTHNRQHSGEDLDYQKKSSSVNSLSTTSDVIEHNELYPDVVDLAEMDYSPARRKTPIHN